MKKVVPFSNLSRAMELKYLYDLISEGKQGLTVETAEAFLRKTRRTKSENAVTICQEYLELCNEGK